MKYKILKIIAVGLLVTLITLTTRYVTIFSKPKILLNTSDKPEYISYIKNVKLQENLETEVSEIIKLKLYNKLETEVSEINSIRQHEDVALLREKLIALLFGNSRLPSSTDLEVFDNIKDNRYDDISSLNRIDKLKVVMDFGIDSIVYHFIPKQPNNKVVLYHEGHNGDFYAGKSQIRRFLENGYSVVAFAMPLLGLNNQPTVKIPRIGSLSLTSHDKMKFLSLLPENSGHPLKYFVEPVFIVLNYLEKNFKYSSVSMVGISGGGWTTTIASAIDPRIQNSFPVAGSYPIYLRDARDWGDYEQNVTEIYTAVDYLELYILGAYGIDRKQIQIINQYDSCCFAGTKWQIYVGKIREVIHKLYGKGEFDVFMDSSHKEHIFSDLAMSKILEKI